MRRESSRLPRRETAARDLSWASLAAFPCNPRSRISVQQRDGTGDMCSGAAAVTVPGATRGLDKLSGHPQQIARALLQHRCVDGLRRRRAQLLVSAFMLMRVTIGRSLRNSRCTLGRGWRRFAVERSHACSVRECPGSESPPDGGLSAHEASRMTRPTGGGLRKQSRQL